MVRTETNFCRIKIRPVPRIVNPRARETEDSRPSEISLAGVADVRVRRAQGRPQRTRSQLAGLDALLICVSAPDPGTVRVTTSPRPGSCPSTSVTATGIWTRFTPRSSDYPARCCSRFAPSTTGGASLHNDVVGDLSGRRDPVEPAVAVLEQLRLHRGHRLADQTRRGSERTAGRDPT